jgi:hypothetical protein
MVFLGACVDQNSALRSGAQTRDSAGVQIVESHEPAWTAAEQLRLAAQPSLVIGTRPEKEYTLSRVHGAARLADGRIIIADGSTLQLKVFDSSGTYLTAFGGPGNGPGEFSRMSGFARKAGDTLVVFGEIRDVTFMNGAGEFLWRTLASDTPREGTMPRLTMPVSAFANGNLVLVDVGINPTPRSQSEPWLEHFAPQLVNRNRESIRTLDSIPMGMVVMDDQFPRSPWLAPEFSWTADDEFFYCGFPAEYRIRVYTRNGELRRIISRKWSPVAITRSDIDAYVVEWGKRWIRSTGAEAEKARADLSDDPYAETVPAFSQLLADRAGNLWVREAKLPDAARAGSLAGVPLVESTWSVFNADGRWLGDVAMPADFLPHEIGADYVLGVARDTDGVEVVVMYRLQPAAARS